jgi:hypothetical protein
MALDKPELAKLKVIENEQNREKLGASPKQMIEVLPTPAGKQSIPVTPVSRLNLLNGKGKWAGGALLAGLIAGAMAFGIAHKAERNGSSDTQLLTQQKEDSFSTSMQLTCQYEQGVFAIDAIPENITCVEKVLKENWEKESLIVVGGAVTFKVHEDDDREYIVNFYRNQGINGYCSGFYQSVSCLNPELSMNVWQQPHSLEASTYKAFSEEQDESSTPVTIENGHCESHEFEDKEIPLSMNLKQHPDWISYYAAKNLRNSGLVIEFQKKCNSEVVISFLNSDYSKFDIDEGILIKDNVMLQVFLKKARTDARFGIFGDWIFSKATLQSLLDKCVDQEHVKIEFCQEKQSILISTAHEDELLDEYEIILPQQYRVGPFAFSATESNFRSSAISNLKWSDCSHC